MQPCHRCDKAQAQPAARLRAAGFKPHEAVEHPVDRYNQLHPDHLVEIEAGLVDALLSEVASLTASVPG